MRHCEFHSRRDVPFTVQPVYVEGPLGTHETTFRLAGSDVSATA